MSCSSVATMSSQIPPYPPIDPTSYDLILVGSGLTESIIAAAASSAGKSVLHLDPNSFYGSHFSSLSLPDLSSFLASQSTPPPPPASISPPPSDGGSDLIAVDLSAVPLYSSVEISNFAPDILEEHSRKFGIDVCGPRVLFCADKSIDVMLKSGCSRYVEFKSVDASFFGDLSGKLQSVPDSRAAIFKDRTMSLTEKNQLMKFFKLVQDHLASPHDDTSGGEERARISEDDLESPFVEFLSKMRLPSKIKSIVLYAIAMLDYDQERTEACKDLLKTKEGINRLALYSSSMGRFSNALGALIYPMYGQGELPQAFCRRAAVKGCLHVLRMPVAALLLDKDTGDYKGIRLASGQDIFSQKLVLDPCITVPLPSMSDQCRQSFKVLNPKSNKGNVARGICITKSSVKPDISNVLVVYPPKSLFPEQGTAIRVLQIGSGLAVCPTGMYVMYLSTLCNDADQGKRLLLAAINALLKPPVSEDILSDSEVQGDNTEEKPTLLWRALYIQELIEGQCESIISSSPMPDGHLNYNEILESATKLFQFMFPSEEFFPEEADAEKEDDDDDGDQ